MQQVRLEYWTQHSQRFWESRLEGNIRIIRFGQIGILRKPNEKLYPSPEKALADHRREVCKRLAQGFKPTEKTVMDLIGRASEIENPIPIASMRVGADVPKAVMKDLCGWMTVCLWHQMPEEQFETIWNNFIKDIGDEEVSEALGETRVEGVDDMRWTWLTVLENAVRLDDLYAEAAKNDGNRFTWHISDGCTNIISLRGDPGAKAK